MDAEHVAATEQSAGGATTAAPSLLTVAAALLGGLPVLGHCETPYEAAGRWWTIPTLRLDARGRPDVIDLPRAHLAEPGGENRATVRLTRYNGESVALVDFRTPRPVEAWFSLLLPLAQYSAVSRAAAVVGALGWTHPHSPRGAVVIHQLADLAGLRALLAEAAEADR